MAIEVGASASWQRRVDADMTADRWGNPGVLGEGTHERVLVDLDRFMQRVASRPLESR